MRGTGHSTEFEELQKTKQKAMPFLEAMEE
jgi:hypothetical protein